MRVCRNLYCQVAAQAPRLACMSLVSAFSINQPVNRFAPKVGENGLEAVENASQVGEIDSQVGEFDLQVGENRPQGVEWNPVSPMLSTKLFAASYKISIQRLLGRFYSPCK